MRSFALIPAAGLSRRMGVSKLFLPWGDATVIERVLAAWRAGGVDHCVVVPHPDDDRLIELCRAAGARAAIPRTPPAEMKDSVGVGLAWIAGALQPRPDDAWLVAPADMPQLDADVVRLLIAAHRAGLAAGDLPAPVRVPSAADKTGHPVLFPWPLAAQVARLGDHEGLDALVARQRVVRLEVGRAALGEDFDTPAEYRRLRARFERSRHAP